MNAGRDVAVLRYHEIVLKGRNRPVFVRRLLGNVQRATADLPVGSIRPASARLLLPVLDPAALPAVRRRLLRIFGVANVSLAREVPLAADGRSLAVLEPLADAILARLEGVVVSSFRVDTRRADKRFPITSPEVNAFLGERIKRHTGAAVDLRRAELTVGVDLLPGHAFIAVDKLPGAGGLPIGTSGRVLALLSGGIDSPVAAWRMMRRGCQVDFVHFHSAPLLDRAAEEKARALAAELVTWELGAVFVSVPFAEVQRQIVASVARPLRVVLYRRMMLRIAAALAPTLGAEALVTGDSLGQVASQTLPNLAVIGAAIDLPVLRPLIGMDKNEIAAAAMALGTFETSVLPDQDCCQLFVPRHPATRASPADVAQAEARLDVAGLVALAAGSAERTRLVFPPRRGGHAVAAG